jgi:AcrR family transcriptional regulator
MSLREEKREQLRFELIAAAEALFRENGFDETP